MSSIAKAMITHWTTQSLGHSSIFPGKMLQQRQRVLRESTKEMTKLVHHTFVLAMEEKDACEEVILGRVLVKHGILRERNKTSIHSNCHREI